MQSPAAWLEMPPGVGGRLRLLSQPEVPPSRGLCSVASEPSLRLEPFGVTLRESRCSDLGVLPELLEELAPGGSMAGAADGGATAGASSTLQHDEFGFSSDQLARAFLGGTSSVPGTSAVATSRQYATCECGKLAPWGGAGEQWGKGTVIGLTPARVGAVAPSKSSCARHSSFLDNPLPLSHSEVAPARSVLCEAKRI